MRKYLYLIGILLLLPAIYVYGTDGVSGVEHPAKVNSVVTPDKVCGVSGLAADGAASDFSDDFNRSDSGTVGGDWTDETDTQSNLAILSNELHFELDSTTAAIVYKDFGSDHDELTIIYKIESNDVTGVGNGSDNLSNVFAYDTGKSQAQFSFRLRTDASGDFTLLKTEVVEDDLGSADNYSSAISPSANEMYEVRIYYKKATAGNTDGIIKVKFDGNEVISNTTIDNDQREGVGYIEFPHTSNNWSTTNSTNLYFDDFELYWSNQY